VKKHEVGKEVIKLMDVTLNFGCVALRSDPIFGVLVFTEDGWVPFSEGTPEERDWVRNRVLSHSLSGCLTDGMRKALKR
jgi:hypothetical protein